MLLENNSIRCLRKFYIRYQYPIENYLVSDKQNIDNGFHSIYKIYISVVFTCILLFHPELDTPSQQISRFILNLMAWIYIFFFIYLVHLFIVHIVCTVLSTDFSDFNWCQFYVAHLYWNVQEMMARNESGRLSV